jgi:hypothetical protein
MTASATYRGEEIEVSFTAETERTDYGVPGSPVWDEIDLTTVRVSSIEILGVEVKHFLYLPKDLQDAILGLADGLEWE